MEQMGNPSSTQIREWAMCNWWMKNYKIFNVKYIVRDQFVMYYE